MEGAALKRLKVNKKDNIFCLKCDAVERRVNECGKHWSRQPEITGSPGGGEGEEGRARKRRGVPLYARLSSLKVLALVCLKSRERTNWKELHIQEVGKRQKGGDPISLPLCMESVLVWVERGHE